MSALYNLAARWEVRPLGDLCSGGDASIQTGPFGSQLHASDYVENGIPCVMPQDIRAGRISTGSIARITGEDHARLSCFQLRKGDIVYPRRGDISKRALIEDREAGWLCGTGCLRIRPNTASTYPKFLAYYLSHPDVCAWIEGNAVGATMPHLNTGLAGSVPVVCPPLEEQREIAAILGALDDKIELNRRMSATLEAMARALYRSWFVDFDPVHARARGDAPAHMDPATAALFPDRFGEDGLPEGWAMTRLDQVCNHNKRTVKPSDHPGSPFQHFSLPAFDKGAGAEKVLGAEIKSNKLDVPEDAILFSRLNPTIPRVWWARVASNSGAPAASTEFFIATAASKVEIPWLYSLLSSTDFRDDAKSRVTGTSNSHQRIPPSSLAEIEVVCPTSEIREAFGSVTLSWFRRIQSAASENHTLATLRDTLLPKLMSGEIRIRDAEALVGEVA